MQAAHLVAKTKLGWKPQYDLAGGYEVGRLRRADPKREKTEFARLNYFLYFCIQMNTI